MALPGFFKKPEQLKASHILIKVSDSKDEAKKAEAKKKIEMAQERLKKGEDFAVLAKEFSECPSSANGGDLGYFSRGRMVKPFEDAAYALKVNETSDIVETSFGYHIIRLTEKKAQEIVDYENAKVNITRHLKQQKTQKKVKEYLEEIRKSAKIEKFL